MPLTYGLNTGQGTGDKPVVNGFMHQRAAWAGAYLPLIEGEHGKAFHRFVQIVIIVLHHIGKKDVWRLAPQLQRGRDQVFRCGMGNCFAGRRGAGKRDFGNARTVGQSRPHIPPKAVHNVQRAGGKEVTNQFHQHQHAGGRCFGWLHDHAVARRQSGSQLPCPHENREVPRNNLPDNAQWFMKMVGNGRICNFAQGTFLRAQAPGKIAKMVNCQRNVRRQCLTDRFAVIPCFRSGKEVKTGLHAVRRPEQQQSPFSRGSTRP